MTVTEPYIYVWASDMRADPKIIGLNGDEKWALIQAWDLAKNGPGDPDELRDVDGSPMTATTLRQIAGVSPNATRGIFERWQRRGLATLEDGLVRFPKLRRRQKLDATNAARQARFRQKRNAESNGAVTDPVTPYARVELEPEPINPLTPTSGGTRSTGTNPRAIAELAERNSKRAAAIAACRRTYNGYLDAGEKPDTAREWMLNEYRHDPTIVQEAIS